MAMNMPDYDLDFHLKKVIERLKLRHMSYVLKDLSKLSLSIKKDILFSLLELEKRLNTIEKEQNQWIMK